MNLRSLSYFVAVAEELNISRAAEKLNMSQPPLSTQIKNLEYDLNTTLFVRGKRQLMLTESGQLLYRRAKEIINLADKAEEEILALTKGMSGTISLGLVEGMAPDIAAEWFSGFMKDHSRVRFRILDGNSDDLIEKLLSGIISLAVITAPCNQSLLNSFPVGNEKMTVLMRKDHPLALSGKETLDVSDIIDEPLIVPSRKADIDTIYKWFRSTRKEPNIVCEIDSSLNAAALAGRGIGICVFPKTAYVPSDSLVSIDIDNKSNKVEYLFVWRKGHPLPTIEEAFIDYIKDIAMQS
ncbi:DNA-binding transcriptional regulator, LysR family [Lachnospiraceae bacterium YSD2013]|nr:DNA-binding transcriptional regulator, LysR family [Lachnospiraceae bacterium YSD2013]